LLLPYPMMGHGKFWRISRGLFILLGVREAPQPGSPRHPAPPSQRSSAPALP